MTDHQAAAVSIKVANRLDPGEADDVAHLAAQATLDDGAAPFSENTMLRLRQGGGTHVLARDAQGLAGYAFADTDPAEGPTRADGPEAELAVASRARGTAVGDAVLDSLLLAAGPRLRLWAHGDRATSKALAEARGFRAARTLLRMRRSLAGPLPPARLPAGFQITAFAPGTDEQDWVEVNARAFTELPDQGSWTRDDLALRLAEPWFDAGGFLLARDQLGKLAGFHWTKIHGPGAAAASGAEPESAVGEIYVLGVDPGYRGLHLGSALAILGLEYLRSRGLRAAILYVDSQNTAAIRTYSRFGFREYATDVLYLSERE